jgi:hypothetical protein
MLHVQLQKPGTIALFGIDSKRLLETETVQQATWDLKELGLQPGVYHLVSGGRSKRIVVL